MFVGPLLLGPPARRKALMGGGFWRWGWGTPTCISSIWVSVYDELGWEWGRGATSCRNWRAPFQPFNNFVLRAALRHQFPRCHLRWNACRVAPHVSTGEPLSTSFTANPAACRDGVRLNSQMALQALNTREASSGSWRFVPGVKSCSLLADPLPMPVQ